MFAKLREPVNGLTHFFAAIVAAAGLIVLIVLGWPSLIKEVTLSVYGVSLIFLFAASATYHLAGSNSQTVAALRKLDHAAIYFLIAGTYTPICAIMFTGFWKWGLLAIIWSLAVIGIVVKMFVMNASRWLTAAVYIIMGWLCLAAINEMLRVLPVGALAWLLVGGIVYTLGAVVYSTKKPDFWPSVFGFHETWHIFVILGALAHFIAIAAYIAPRAI